MSDPSAELQSTLRDLAIGEKGPVQDIPRPIPSKTTPPKSAPSTSKPKKPAAKPVADSWEDEANLSSDDEPGSTADTASPSVLSPALSAEGPLDPLQRPSHCRRRTQPASPGAGPKNPARRPEKQTAVAGRLIAGALGIRAPKRTEEQRAYDRSVKEQEIRRRNREREELAKAREEDERAKANVWTD
ncbi:uncharacterized protein N7458_006506 [Penicillium daleae]|uniref:Uncharacterized protein n=1 Tax=Penicillium daleae TaxID=63821 RepID=A0AAD6G1S5_9EURO|nr:uncharacterized protein N7458_006506 [Penicillium daleae]KAJ5450057.1 hypothetical protein N7458_006506 [Penicillium daleae]